MSVLWWLSYSLHRPTAELNAFNKQNNSMEKNNAATMAKQGFEPDVPRRLALSNFEHLVSLSSEHTDRQTDRQTVENTVWIAL